MDVTWLATSKFTSSPPCFVPWWSLPSVTLHISNSYLSLSCDTFTESITLLSFSCNVFHLCCLWYPVEDGSDVSVPRTITFLLFLLLQQLFILCLCALPILSRKGSVGSSTTLCMSVPTWNPHPHSPLLRFVVTFFYGLQVSSFRLQNIKCCCHLLINAKKFYCVSAE